MQVVDFDQVSHGCFGLTHERNLLWELDLGGVPVETEVVEQDGLLACAEQDEARVFVVAGQVDGELLVGRDVHGHEDCHGLFDREFVHLLISFG